MVGYADTTSRATCADVDPVLERQLTLAGEDQLVEAVLLLRGSDDTGHATSPDALLARAGNLAGSGAVLANYLPRLGALMIRARPSIIRQLIAQPEVEFASANRA